MKQYDHVIIGFGKGGKTLAGAFAEKGQKVALIEGSDKMFGGTCINAACIPSKSLEYHARLYKEYGWDFSDKSLRYQEAIHKKRELTAMLRGKNYDKASSAGVEIIVGEASFADSHRITVKDENGALLELKGEQIYINTGARPFIPAIPGLKESSFAYTSETLMELDVLPQKLLIIGGGYIGLEFASYYANFGSQVTILQNSGSFLPREDTEIAKSVLERMEQRGIRLLLQTQILSVADCSGHAVITVNTAGEQQELEAQAVLVATGRRPNTKGLHPERAGITLTEQGAIPVDETLRTCVPHIRALGDVTGGLQFTYISLDDSRIVLSQLIGDKKRTAKNRGEIPYCVFMDPPLSRVGITEQQALNKGYHYKAARLQAAAIPKAQVLEQTAGMLKLLIDTDTNLILGAHFFCAESFEMISLIKLAMDAKVPYTVLKNSIYTHPTMSEAMNDLLHSL